MSALNAGMAELEAALSAATGLRATRDPDTVLPPCLFLDAPTITGRTAGGWRLAVPVHLVAPGTGAPALEWLLDNVDTLAEACGENEATPASLTVGGATYPVMTITATITIQRSTP